MAEDERMEVGGGLAEEEEVAVVVHDAAETEGTVQFSLKGVSSDQMERFISNWQVHIKFSLIGSLVFISGLGL